MFNNKKIKSLERTIENFNADIKYLAKRVWKLENPCKYKIGDKIKDLIVVDISIEIGERTACFVATNYSAIPIGYYYKITAFNLKTNSHELYFNTIK